MPFHSNDQDRISTVTSRYDKHSQSDRICRNKICVGQYFFFYIGVAHTSGVKGGIITGLGNFIAILMSCLIVRNEKLTGRKLTGCILGFAGVVVINLLGNSLDFGFTMMGEGFVLISQLAYATSTILINYYSKKYHQLY